MAIFFMEHVDPTSVGSINDKLTTLPQVLDVFRNIRFGKLANMNPCLTHFDVLSKYHVFTLMEKAHFFMVFIEHTTHPPILGKNLNQAIHGMHGHAANRALKLREAHHITHIRIHDNSSTFSVDKTLAFHPKFQSDQASLPRDYFFITR
ncbi:MAG: hypothetical protein ABT21_14405 [Thiobacillus sp. SCN 65-179]|nr:MAG: hypothetical protein ABT21_14405 [Thiobacillus sp. SCN 65-179]